MLLSGTDIQEKFSLPLFQHCHTASQSKGEQEDGGGQVEKEEEEDARGGE